MTPDSSADEPSPRSSSTLLVDGGRTRLPSPPTSGIEGHDGEVVRMLVHDLQSPAAVAEGYLTMAVEDATQGERVDPEHLEKALSSVHRIQNLLSEADTFAGVSEGSPTEERQPRQLKEMATKAWETTETEGAELELEDDATFEVYPTLFTSIFENLFRNAAHHAGEDVTVRVGTFDHEDNSGFYVEDTGTGIPPEKREQAVMPGYTTDSGSGLGLAIVQRVAAIHEWHVYLTESAEGGARFEFVTDSEEQPASPVAESEDSE